MRSHCVGYAFNSNSNSNTKDLGAATRFFLRPAKAKAVLQERTLIDARRAGRFDSSLRNCEAFPLAERIWRI